MAQGLLPPVLYPAVQAQLPARRREGGLRLPEPPGRLAYAQRRSGKNLAPGSGTAIRIPRRGSDLGAPPGLRLVPKAFAKEGGSTLGYRPLGCTFARTVGAVIRCAQPVHFTVDWLDWICYFT